MTEEFIFYVLSIICMTYATFHINLPLKRLFEFFYVNSLTDNDDILFTFNPPLLFSFFKSRFYLFHQFLFQLWRKKNTSYFNLILFLGEFYGLLMKLT